MAFAMCVCTFALGGILGMERDTEHVVVDAS